jgi:hypothetical protein
MKDLARNYPRSASLEDAGEVTPEEKSELKKIGE